MVFFALVSKIYFYLLMHDNNGSGVKKHFSQVSYRFRVFKLPLNLMFLLEFVRQLNSTMCRTTKPLSVGYGFESQSLRTVFYFTPGIVGVVFLILIKKISFELLSVDRIFQNQSMQFSSGVSSFFQKSPLSRRFLFAYLIAFCISTKYGANAVSSSQVAVWNHFTGRFCFWMKIL